MTIESLERRDVGAPTLTEPYALIPLSLIDPNPWQPREGYNGTYIRELAADIESRRASRPATYGLLQVAAARVVTKTGKVLDMAFPTGFLGPYLSALDARIQLAYGHNRWKAFEHLNKQHPGDWDLFPVDLVAWSDEEMATAAWAENAARRDLNAIEEAKAIERYMRDFGWSQQQVADRLKMDRSTVAHKTRLLKLPEAQQQQVRSGELSARQAAALMPLLELPADVIAAAEKDYYKPSAILKAAAKSSSDDIRRNVQSILSSVSRTLTGERWLDYQFAARGLRSSKCTDCPLLEQSKGMTICRDKACAEKKNHLWRDERLAAAQQATGVAVLRDTMGIHTYFHGGGSYESGQTAAIAQKCQHLRLYPSTSGLQVPEHPGVAYGCALAGGCACSNAARREQQIKAQEEQAAQRVAHQTQVLEPAIFVLSSLLEAGDLTIWQSIIDRLKWYDTTITLADPADIWRALGHALISQALSWQARQDVAKAQKELTAYFKKFGHDVTWPGQESAPPQPLEDQVAELEIWICDEFNSDADTNRQELNRWLQEIKSWHGHAGLTDDLRERIAGCLEELAQLSKSIED